MSGEDNAIGRGTRRKKLAGYLKAANELRQSYTQAYLGSSTRSEFEDEDDGDIPGAFPNLKVSRSGNEELVLFPSYARRHTKKAAPDYPISSELHDANGSNDADYWRREWEVYEDANAIVDVDVRGWIYTPHRGPMNRKNRILLGIARHLSGIPAPPSGNLETTQHEDRIAEREAQDITRRGEEEADVAGRGGYSESFDRPSSTLNRASSPRPGHFQHSVTESALQDEGPGPGFLKKASSWSTIQTDMSPEELATANTQLLRRLKPFFTTPAVGMSITIFYYNDHTSQSRTTQTNDSGHFNFRAALNFVPTNVRVLASEDLSASSEIIITEPKGVSLISDIDDTIKHSAISMGAREIFRNAFVRELDQLVVQGVREWYHKMANMGVKIHYVSNSPWQMYPLLVTYFALANLPHGSFHLKQYTGMLQGIFEPVAERKKATLDRIMSDFPERKFILVGDSGEADLELYTETALREPKRILAIFIRDVTTSQSPGFFDSSEPENPHADSAPKIFQPRPRNNSASSPISTSLRPDIPPTDKSDHSSPAEIEDLMSFSDDETDKAASEKKPDPSQTNRGRPPPPSKPLALRSASGPLTQSELSGDAAKKQPPLPPARKPTHGSNEQTGFSVTEKLRTAYNSIPSASDVWSGTDQDKTNNQSQQEGVTTSVKVAPPLPPRRGLTAYPAAAASYASSRVSAYWNGVDPPSRSSSQTPVNKREELWNRRLARAKESLQGKGIVIRTWRVGGDVEKEAIALVEKYMRK